MGRTLLPPRSSRILATVVREYIATGEPVASMVIARRGAVGVSAATIRNVLARLEEEGFVRQPHTSAGRVPTDRGYRYYVDQLLESRRVSRRPEIEDAIRHAASEDPALDPLLARVSRLLST
ncbi:MAG TPA: HrcA family transcriptional regulator, partial [Vicinamibacterales bacterium]